MNLLRYKMSWRTMETSRGLCKSVSVHIIQSKSFIFSIHKLIIGYFLLIIGGTYEVAKVVFVICQFWLRATFLNGEYLKDALYHYFQRQKQYISAAYDTFEAATLAQIFVNFSTNNYFQLRHVVSTNGKYIRNIVNLFFHASSKCSHTASSFFLT